MGNTGGVGKRKAGRAERRYVEVDPGGRVWEERLPQSPGLPLRGFTLPYRRRIGPGLIPDRLKNDLLQLVLVVIATIVLGGIAAAAVYVLATLVF
jgi:hypothetical protein